MEDLFLIDPHAVHVWSLRLDLYQAADDRLERVISADEAARADRFVVAADRRRYVAARGLLRVVLSGYLGVRPHDVALEAGARGKPQLANRADPRFNLSHAGALGLVAVSADREVGVDIEEIRDVGDLEDLAETCFSPVERAALTAVPATQRQRAFFAGWTRKEAFLKALGEGLSWPLASFDVTLTPGEAARLLRVHEAPGAPGRYALRSLRPAPGYVGALAIDGRGATVHCRPWGKLAALLEVALGRHFEVEPAGLPRVGEREQ
jgi:4'-phosphopantetheinyl transferase